jgi:hypothetical protein
VRLVSDYIHPTPRDGRCRIRIYLPEDERDAPVVICSELPNNEGSSVTYSVPLSLLRSSATTSSACHPCGSSTTTPLSHHLTYTAARKKRKAGVLRNKEPRFAKRFLYECPYTFIMVPPTSVP